MLPIRIAGALLAGLWGTAVLMWLVLDPYWTRRHMTEARRREKEAAKAQPHARPPVDRAWSAIAIVVLLALPTLYIVDALLLPLGLLYAPSLSFIPPFASAWQIGGVAVTLVGLWIMLTVGRTLARKVFAKAEAERSLITSGLHARIRHPFYLHFILVPLGLLLLTLNVLSLLLVLFYTTLFGPKSLLTVMKEEEAYLREKYGEEYEVYMGRTGRLFPRLRR